MSNKAVRSLTVFLDEAGEEIAVMYGQADGEPERLGAAMVRLMQGRSLVNGFTAEDVNAGHFNGMNDLAAAVVANFKRGTGGFYLYPAGTRNLEEQYIYSIRPSSSWDPLEYRSKGRIVVTLHTYDPSYKKDNRGIGRNWKPKVLSGFGEERPRESMQERHGV